MTISDGYIDTDKERGSFRINQKVYADQRIFEEEAARVFDRCWLYLGHESEVPKPNAYLLRTIAGRPLIFSRDGDGKVRCFLNICPHRGAALDPHCYPKITPSNGAWHRRPA